MKRHGTRILTLCLSTWCVVIAATMSAKARPAQCFTSNEGEYPCEVSLVEFNGSFAISAVGRPTYSLIMDAPGFAFGFVNRGDRDVALPGIYERESEDPACWRSRETDARICAW